MKKILSTLFLALFSLPVIAQLGIGVTASYNSPVTWTREFYAPNAGIKVFIVPNIYAREMRWSLGFGWTKFAPRAEVFKGKNRNGFLVDVSYSDYLSIPMFGGLDFDISRNSSTLYAGVYVGLNYVNYTVNSEGRFEPKVEEFNGVNLFFSPKLGLNLLDSDQFSLGLEGQYYFTINYTAGWIEDYAGLGLTFLFKTGY